MDVFEENRAHLHAVATRILGSRAEADDALQEAWLRVQRADLSDVENVPGWLTTVVSRVCLTMLDSRRRRREEALEAGRLPDPIITRADDTAPDPEGEALAADAVGTALLVVLETLPPAERLAFVLHDVFAVPFDDIATIVDRSPAAARQLASRARRRVQGADRDAATADREVVNAFLAAARDGDFDGLMKVLDPDVVLRGDDGSGAVQVIEGARAIASRARYGARGRVPHPAIVDGAAGFVATEDGVPVAVLAFTVVGGRITAIDALEGKARVARLRLEAFVADVTLRPIDDSDLDALFDQMRDPDSVQMAAFTVKDPDDREEFERRMAKSRTTPDGTMRAVVHDGRLVGSIASFVVEGETEITYWIDRSVWGRGIASRALALFLDTVRVRPVYARAAGDNVGSLKVLQRAGFRVIGTETSYANARRSEIEETVLRLD